MAPPDFTRPLERHTLENLSYAAAEIYHKKGETVGDEARAVSSIWYQNYMCHMFPDMKCKVSGVSLQTKMLNALDSLPSNQDRINFLLQKSYLNEALPIMKKEGKNYPPQLCCMSFIAADDT